MARRLLIILPILVLAAATALFFLGRGRIEDRPSLLPGPSALLVDPWLQSVRLFFGDPLSYRLLTEERVVVSGRDMTEQLRICIRELASGPLAAGAPVLPSQARLNEAFVDPWGLAYLDFNRAFLGQRRARPGEEWLAIASVVHTVTANFPEIRRIRFMIDGQVITSLAGYIDLEEPVGPEQFPLDAALR